MLKAVRFDEDTHKELIDYIENYRDKRGKQNHSEAIRFLMEKGFETIHGKPIDTEPQTPQPQIDLDKFREDIMKEVFATIGKQSINSREHTFTQVNNPVIEELKEEIKQEPVKQQTPIPSSFSANSFMGNLLSNANR